MRAKRLSCKKCNHNWLLRDGALSVVPRGSFDSRAQTMRFRGKTLLLAGAVLMALSGPAGADNLISNADFENGDTGFTSAYTPGTGACAPGLDAERCYVVGEDPNTFRNDTAFDGVTANGGTKFFMANGGRFNTDTVWRSNNLISVTQANTAYRFEAHVVSLFPISALAPGPDLEFEIGDGTVWVPLGSTVSFANGENKGVWKFTFADGTFTATGNYFLRLRNDQTALNGNDFGLDDIYFGLAANAPSVGTNPVGTPTSFNTGGLTAIPNIDTAKARYTTAELVANQVGPTFEGGTLQAAATTTLNNVLMVQPTNGTIDTNGFDLTLSGAVIGTGGLTKSGTGVLALDGNTIALGSGLQVGAGELSLTAASLTVGADLTVATGAILSGTGTITGDVQVSGTLRPGNSPGTTTVVGSVTQLPGSTFEEEIDGTGTGNGAGNFDRLILTGATSVFTADGTLSVLLRGISAPANNTFTPALWDSFTIVEAEGGVTGTFDTLNQPTSGLPAGTRFDAIYNANSIVLLVAPSSFSDTVSSSGLLNARAAATAFDRTRAQGLLAGLAGLSGTELDRAFQQLAGDINASAISGARRSNRLIRNGILSRLTAPTVAPGLGEPVAQTFMSFAATVAPGEIDIPADMGTAVQLAHSLHDALDKDADARVWISVGLEKSETDADQHALASKAYTTAVYGGLDIYRTPHARAGLAFAHADTRVDTDFGSNADTNSYQLFAYGGLFRGNGYLFGSAGYAHDRQETRRRVDLSGTTARADGDTDGYTLSGDLEAGFHIPLGFGERFTLTPNTRTRIEYFSRDAFTETGDAAIALSQDAADGLSGQLALGATLSRRFGMPHERSLTLGIGSHVLYDFGDARNVSVINSLGGQPFEVAAPDADRYAYQASLSGRYEMSERIAVSVNAAATLNSEQTSEHLVTSVKYRW